MPSRSNSTPASPPSSVLLIGTFDGVHRGHATLIHLARQAALDHASPPAPAPLLTALVFDPSPAEVLRPADTNQRLTTFDQRAGLLRELGADRIVRLNPTPRLLSLTPDQFIEHTVRRYNPVAVIEGADFRFGHRRAGDISTLESLGRRFNFEVRIAPSVSVALSDNTLVPARSSIIRWLLQQGRARDAAIVLGRPHRLPGIVVRGERRGRTIGCPTANLLTTCMLPADGVYAGNALLPDGRSFPAAISVGTKPTFHDAPHAVEAHLIDAHPSQHPATPALPSLPEYGWPMELELTAWIREQVRFDSVRLLTDQIQRDIARCRELAFDRPRDTPLLQHGATA